MSHSIKRLLSYAYSLMLFVSFFLLFNGCDLMQQEETDATKVIRTDNVNDTIYFHNKNFILQSQNMLYNMTFSSQSDSNFPVKTFYLDKYSDYILHFYGTVTTMRQDSSLDFNDCFFYWHDNNNNWRGFSPHMLLNNYPNTCYTMEYSDSNSYYCSISGIDTLNIKCTYNFDIIRNEYKWIVGNFYIDVYPDSENMIRGR